MANAAARPPALTVRNMYTVCPVRGSEDPRPGVTATGLTQAAIVKSPQTVHDARRQRHVLVAPFRPTAVPNLPATRCGGGIDPPSVSSQSRVRTAFLMLLASVAIWLALTRSPSSAYISAAALAPEYQNADSVRSCARLKKASATASASLPVRKPWAYSIRSLPLVSNLASCPVTSPSA